MKKTLTTLVLLAIGFGASAGDSAVKQALKSSDSVVWAGLDYSMMRMIGSTNAIKVPYLILQDMPQKWNDLFLDERIEGVADSLGKTMFIDIGAVTERNKTITTNQIIITSYTKNVIEESHITLTNIAAEVRSYKMEHKNGLGLVFIVDRMVYEYHAPDANGHGMATTPTKTQSEAVYVVFFDIATRNLISVKREIGSVATAGSFRNFWFGPIKQIDSDLGKYR